MQDIILHHYDTSPYAGKIRKLLGFKNLSWQSVVIPQIMPKPDLMPLTGGYRMTPVMQIGANVYCDSNFIARHLEKIAPEPALYPAAEKASVIALEHWGNSLFLPFFVAVVAVGGYVTEEFLADRNKIMPTALDEKKAKALAPGNLGKVTAGLHLLESQLADGRDYLLGDQLTAADFAVNAAVSSAFFMPEFAAAMKPFEKSAQWAQRMSAMPEGERTEISSADALGVAKEASPIIGESDALENSGFVLGERLRVFAEDGRCSVEGELVQICENEIVLLRNDDAVGEIAVHFSRSNFTIEKT